MKSISKLMILMLLSISLISLLGLNQVVQERPGKAERMAAMNEFNQKYDNQWKIRWNSSTGTPSTIRGHKITKYSGTLEQIAKSFLNEEKIMLGIDNVERDLYLTKINYMKRVGTTLMFKQKYNDVPILGSGYLIAVNDYGEVYYVSGDYFPEVSVDTKPSLSAEKVNGIIRNDIIGREINSISEPSLYIYAKDRNTEKESYILVYQSIANISMPTDELGYMIDAHTGNILFKKSMIIRVNGSGTVYETNPIHGNVDTLTFFGLNDPGEGDYVLEGENVDVKNDDVPEASSDNGQFFYDPSDTHFDENMAYYQSDIFERWLITLGLGLNQVGKITIHTHNDAYYAASYKNQSKIVFSDGWPSKGLRNPTKESSIITHEYMHQVTRSFEKLNSTPLIIDEEDAMNEAFSDYFALANKNRFLAVQNNTTGEWVDTSSTYNWKRVLLNNWTFDDYNTIEFDNIEGTDYHEQSVIFSGAFWDFRWDNDVTNSEADELVLESLTILDDYATFLDGRDALVDRADLRHPSYVDDVEDAFNAHKIYPPLTVEIDGWDSLYYYEGGQFHADASGGISPYSYLWWITNPYSEETKYIPEYLGGNEIEVYFELEDINELFDDPPDLEPGDYFGLKVRVTDDEQEFEYDYVDIGISAGHGGQKISAKQPPKDFKLEQNYPNPFNPVTTINFQLPKSSNVTLVIYNIQGQEVARLVDGNLGAGYHSVPWRPGNAASGIYIYRLQAGSFSDIKRMLYIK